MGTTASVWAKHRQQALRMCWRFARAGDLPASNCTVTIGSHYYFASRWYCKVPTQAFPNSITTKVVRAPTSHSRTVRSQAAKSLRPSGATAISNSCILSEFTVLSDPRRSGCSSLDRCRRRWVWVSYYSSPYCQHDWLPTICASLNDHFSWGSNGIVWGDCCFGSDQPCLWYASKYNPFLTEECALATNWNIFTDHWWHNRHLDYLLHKHHAVYKRTKRFSFETWSAFLSYESISRVCSFAHCKTTTLTTIAPSLYDHFSMLLSSASTNQFDGLNEILVPDEAGSR